MYRLIQLSIHVENVTFRFFEICISIFLSFTYKSDFLHILSFWMSVLLYLDVMYTIRKTWISSSNERWWHSTYQKDVWLRWVSKILTFRVIVLLSKYLYFSMNYTTPKPTCKNKTSDNNCNQYKSYGYCIHPQATSFMKEWCQKACSFC